MPERKRRRRLKNHVDSDKLLRTLHNNTSGCSMHGLSAAISQLLGVDEDVTKKDVIHLKEALWTEVDCSRSLQFSRKPGTFVLELAHPMMQFLLDSSAWLRD